MPHTTRVNLNQPSVIRKLLNSGGACPQEAQQGRVAHLPGGAVTARDQQDVEIGRELARVPVRPNDIVGL